MRNKLYTITFFSLPDHWSTASPWAAIMERQTWEFLRISQKKPTNPEPPKKFKFLDKKGFELTETREQRAPSPPSRPPFINWARRLWCVVFPLPSWAICLAVLPPSSWTPARSLNARNWKSPWFLSSNWKHQCYQHSSHTKSKPQQLLRR